MKVTIKDVAAKAGVSVTTVSFVLNGHLKEVSEETAKLVLKTVEECGYIPNTQARNLQSQRSGLIALFVPDLTNPYYTEVAQSVMNELENLEYRLALMSSENDLKDKESIKKMLGSSLFDGCLIVTKEVAAIEEYSKTSGYKVPFVLLDEGVLFKGTKVVSGDNVLGGEIVANYLLKNNHKDVVCITGPDKSPNSLSRLAGFLSIYNQKGIAISKNSLVEGDYTFDSGYNGMKELHEKNPSFTAVFCFNDLMALGAMQYLNEHGIRIPDDVSLVGYDNSMFAKTSGPRLTTVEQMSTEIGAVSINMLMNMIEGKAIENDVILIAPQLVEGKTVRKR